MTFPTAADFRFEMANAEMHALRNAVCHALNLVKTPHPQCHIQSRASIRVERYPAHMIQTIIGELTQAGYIVTHHLSRQIVEFTWVEKSTSDQKAA